HDLARRLRERLTRLTTRRALFVEIGLEFFDALRGLITLLRELAEEEHHGRGQSADDCRGRAQYDLERDIHRLHAARMNRIERRSLPSCAPDALPSRYAVLGNEMAACPLPMVVPLPVVAPDTISVRPTERCCARMRSAWFRLQVSALERT